MKVVIKEPCEAAIAEFNNAPEKCRQLAKDFFKALDANRDGQVSYDEFEKFFLQRGHLHVNLNIFHELDRYRNGFLEFEDVLTLYYMVNTQRVACKGCQAWLNELYFTCVECFNSPGCTYDLCVPCYQQMKFQHHHTTFLNSNQMLQRMRNAAKIHPPSAPQQPVNIIIQNNTGMLELVLQALEVALAAAGLASAASSCSIM